jgi:hypothetical protein
MKISRLSLVVFILASSLNAEKVAEFTAGNPNAAINIKLLTPDVLQRSMAGKITMGPRPHSDYFQRHGLCFSVHSSLIDGQPLYLLIHHMDQGIGLVQVQYDGQGTPDPNRPESDPAFTHASQVAGYTTLDTQQPRQALFKLDRPAFQHRQPGGSDLVIYGVKSLVKLELHTDIDPNLGQHIREKIPRIDSDKLALKRPLQLVMTVGINRDMNRLDHSLRSLQELAPVAKALGFNGVETYVAWNFVELEQGVYDWSTYDRVVNAAQRYGLKWFPLLIVGSEYALPDWYYGSHLDVGFKCLEHNQGNAIQSIFCENQTPFVKGFLESFGEHYEPMDVLLGVRLGPSGNYGESQYPAGGNWGYAGKPMHIHIGWWAGDSFASPHFQGWLKKQYESIDHLNAAWKSDYQDFKDIQTFIPQFAGVKRQRKDFVDWYMWAMTDWCERWALWAREYMPKTEIYQSAGGWGFVESGTDFTDQTASMVKIDGGIRATNETDSYAQNFYATRMMSSAARFYGVPFGSEPAGFNSARGVVARIYNILVNNGEHLFFYHPNLLMNDQAVDKWLTYAPLLDQRQDPLIDVAVLYPDTKSKLDDGVFRHLYSFSFNQRVAALRPHLDFDFCSERMILEGALDRYKVLVFLWSDIVEQEVLQAIDRWVKKGGTVIYPYWSKMPLSSVENDFSVYNGWLRQETGQGKVIFDPGDREPPHRYADFIKQQLLNMSALDPLTQEMLRVQKPSEVYVSALQDGSLALLNYNDFPVQVRVRDRDVEMEPYSIEITK